MARVIQSVPEVYTQEIVDKGGGVYDVALKMRVVFDGGDPAGEWHEFNTEAVPTIGTEAHASIHFPFALTQATEGLSLLYDLAIQAAKESLEA